MRTLSHNEAQRFYDWMGAKQDTQRFYEDPAVDDLVAHAGFGQAHAVVEFGCGTGRFAEQLLSQRLPAACRYRGVDISGKMIGLARTRLEPWRDRASVEQTTGSMFIPVPDAAFDRFVACYVLDLLSEDDIRDLLGEARRILEPGGLLCTVALTDGTSLSARIGGALWRGIFSLSPRLLGGCRPLVVRDFLGESEWSVRHHNVITRFGISSEVLVAARKPVG